MNQGKLEVVKQEMRRVNIDILGISELRWTRMGEFHSDDHYIEPPFISVIRVTHAYRPALKTSESAHRVHCGQ